MGVVAETVHQLPDVLVDHCVLGDARRPAIELLAARELPVEQKVCNFQIGCLLGKLVDGIATIAQYPLVAIDERYRAAAGGRVLEGGVIAQEPKVVLGHFDLAKVHGVHGAGGNRNRILAARPIIDNREVIWGHRLSLQAG